MNLNFPNVSLLSFDQQSRFFEAGLNYSNIQRLTINGNIIDLISSFGITGIWTGTEGILNTVANNSNFESLILNGKNFGSGRIQNISFNAGDDVKIDAYTANIIIYQTGNLYNLNQEYYSGIDVANFQYLTNLSESYNFIQKENGGYSYEHTAAITFNSGVGNLNAIQAAKSTAKTLFTGSALGFAFYSGYTSKIGKRFYTESYNKINNTCNFGETFDFDTDSGSYSIIRTNKFDIDDNGIIKVSENGNIKGIVRPTYQNAIDACDYEMDGAYSRCNEIYNIYAPANPYPLLSYPLIRGKTLDIFNNNLDYNILFSNDISNSGIYTWNYIQNLIFSESISKMSEDGEILGRSQNRQMAYQNAQIGFNIMKNGHIDRTNNFYLNHIGNSYNFLEYKEEGFSPYKGIIRYSYRHSNENVVVGTGGVKKIDFQIDDNYPIYYYSKIDIFNYKEVIQKNLNNTVGSRSLKLTLFGERVTSLQDYISNAKEQINLYIPTGLNQYIINSSYSFNPNQNILEVDTVWNYTVQPLITIQI